MVFSLFSSVGNPISALDGVLIAIKDEIDCYPYPTTGLLSSPLTMPFMHISFLFLVVFFVPILLLILLGGTKWLHKFRPCTGDACCVLRLRSCGAILVGKTNMHELGAGVSGINPHYG